MNLGVTILISVAVLMIAALLALFWLIRSVVKEAHELKDDQIESEIKRNSFFGWLNPLSWWRKDATTRLFYQRDAKGRYRKIRRH